MKSIAVSVRLRQGGPQNDINAPLMLLCAQRLERTLATVEHSKSMMAEAFGKMERELVEVRARNTEESHRPCIISGAVYHTNAVRM